MPQHDIVTLLSDARGAANMIQGFITGHSWEDYQGNDLLRSAVERQFTILGEALSQLGQQDAQVAAAVPDLPRIVAFRNVLVHGYAVINDDIVWEIATTRLETLIAALDQQIGAVAS
jgi:uncharacterized protein with HEPN domain